MKTVIFAYSEITRETLKTQLGKPQYSYYFVLEKFLPVLRQLGDVIVIHAPEQADQPLPDHDDIDTRRVLFSFTPPHLAPTHLTCPVVTVFAWEFTTLPDEAWDNDPRNDWRHVFERHAGAIPLSTDTATRIQAMMGMDYVVEPIPVPLFDAIQSTRREDGREPLRPAGTARRMLDTTGFSFIDSRQLTRSETALTLDNPQKQLAFPAWDGSPLSLDLWDNETGRYLVGFHGCEPWGAWSRTHQPGILLPCAIHGDLDIQLEVAGFQGNAGKTLSVSIGPATCRIVLSENFTCHTLHVSCPDGVQLISFSGIPPIAIGNPDDQRRLGFGLRFIHVRRQEGSQTESGQPPHPAPASGPIALDGLVYTSVLNPFDHRKNWTQILSAFVHACRDDSEATLILKMSHSSLHRVAADVIERLGQCQPFACRVICLLGYMSSEQMDALRQVTDFYVNASSCEGLCLPIMEFMSVGIPGIAPRNSAMLDYVDDATHCLVECSPALTIWPHDSRLLLRTQHYRIHWESLENAFRDSVSIARTDPARYQRMSDAAIDRMRAFCGDETVRTKLQHMLRRITGA
jgi:glycosyltransferase involved in cell wall biosynthesis